MKSKNIDFINKWLATTYGKALDGRPNYRIIWSVGEVEKRKGTFEEYYGPIFVRSFFGVKELGKYQYHPDWRERWILERLDFTPSDELCIDIPGHYEPLYVFYNPDGSYQMPSLKAIQFFMFHLLAKKPKIYNWEAEDKKEEEAEAEYFYGQMDDRWGGDLASAIHQQEGVVNPGVLVLPDGNLHWIGEKNAVDSDKPSAVQDLREEAGTDASPVRDSSGVSGESPVSSS